MMTYDNLSHILEELRTMHKLHKKLMLMNCKEITPEQGKLLFMVKDERMSQKELAHHLHITEATLSVRIKRLVDSGLIERQVDRHDKRVYTIVLSEKGKQFMNDMGAHIVYYQQLICKGITKEEYETVIRVIQKIQDNIKEEIR